MDWIHAATFQFEAAILVFVRILAILSSVPFFGTRQIPPMAKIGFSYFLAMILFPVVPLPASLPINSIFYFLMVGKEVMVGFIIGYVSFILLTSVQVAGQIIDLQMGFGIANVFNPLLNIQQSVMAQFEYLLAVLLFVLMDGHHLLLLALRESFKIIPLGHMHFSIHTFNLVNGFLARMFVIAFQIAIPSLAALFITNLCLGFMSRLVPQMNVFFVGFSITLVVGFLVLFINMGDLASVYHRLFGEVIQQTLATMKALR